MQSEVSTGTMRKEQQHYTWSTDSFKETTADLEYTGPHWSEYYW